MRHFPTCQNRGRFRPRTCCGQWLVQTMAGEMWTHSDHNTGTRLDSPDRLQNRLATGEGQIDNPSMGSYVSSFFGMNTGKIDVLAGSGLVVPDTICDFYYFCDISFLDACQMRPKRGGLNARNRWNTPARLCFYFIFCDVSVNRPYHPTLFCPSVTRGISCRMYQ